MGLLGAHMSIAGGLHKAIERGDHLKCEAIQIFTQSARTWKIPPLEDEAIHLFQKTLRDAHSVKKVVAHNSYLLNLSTENKELRIKSIRYFIETMQRCETLEIAGLITHPGSHLGAGVESGIRCTIESVDEVLKACSGFKTKLMLENTAGQGGCVGHDFEHLRQITEGCREPERIFFCVDTQHSFAAGYDWRCKSAYQKTLREFDKLLSTKKIQAFHLNDSMKEFGSRVDRHENIGKGYLGKEPFGFFLNDRRFLKIPMCLETDPGEKDKMHKRDLKILRSLIRK